MPEILLHDPQRGWLSFSQPQHIISARHIDEVIPALTEIERLVEKDNLHAAGFISYEASPAFDPALATHPAGSTPLLWFGLFPTPQISQDLPEQTGEYQLGEWVPSVTRRDYHTAIAAVKENIARGLTYQVNYTLRLRTHFSGSARALFGAMVRAQAPGYSGFLDTGEQLICSASPELFFHLQGETITCRPMKGTVKRGRWFAEDQARAAWLQSSEKNRAENVMIVDMLRNDLGRLAEVGSVRVPALFTAERYRTLWQMTSTVTARTGASFVEILKDLFPCASITGAPKVSTMRIITALESTPRGLYTGAIGYLSPGRQAQFNVAIRTLVIDPRDGQATYGVGGGIVWDSTPSGEYEEALLKARVLTRRHPSVSLFETLRWEPAANKIGYTLLDEHLTRLTQSATYFSIAFRKEDARQILEEASRDWPDSPRRVRLVLDHTGQLNLESAPLPATSAVPVGLGLARTPVQSTDIFLYHKTTMREVYERARQEQPDCDDVLLFNERGQLTETTIANLVLELGGRLYTPPIASGLLPGTLRASLIASGRIRERILRPVDLSHATHIYLINSVRGWREAHMVAP